MNDKGQLLDLAGSITPLAARLYAISRGWESDDRGYDHGLILMKRRDEDLRQLLIPLETGTSTYARAILDVAEKLSQIEERPPIAILSDVLFVGSDVLRFKVESPDLKSGLLSLDGGISLLNGARQSILSSACSVLNPVRHHARMALDEAKRLVQSCLFGQTERGSFTVKIACPIDAVPDAQPDGTEDSFTRKSTKNLLRATQRIVTLIERNATAQLEEIEAKDPLISANLCDAILKMGASQEDSSLVISVNWSGVIDPPADHVPQAVKLTPDYFPIVQKISATLRGKEEPTNSTFVGTVEELRGEINKDGRRVGDVILSVIHEGELVSARVSLNVTDHAIADAAYMKGSQIKVRGIFVPGDRLHSIKEVAEFGLVN